MEGVSGMNGTAKMLLFLCPHCDELLKVPETYLGQRGRCNKCGGRIALIGDANVTTPQAASLVADETAPDPRLGPPKPASDKQLDYLRALGAPEQVLQDLDRERASTLIDELKEKRQRGESPTEKQWAYLKRLGATERQLAGVRSKADAARLIEDLHLSPTADQIKRLTALGASGARLAALKSKAAADALIEELSGS